MKLSKIWILVLLIGCSSSTQEKKKHDNNDNCNKKIKNFIDTKIDLVYSKDGKIDSSEIYIEYFSHQNMQIYDVKHFTKGRHAFNLICFGDK